MLTEMRRGLLGGGRQRSPEPRDRGRSRGGRQHGLADCVLDVPPTETPGRVRQTFALMHMLDLPGRRAEDVQLLVAPGRRCMCAGLVFLPLSHARL
jgi:hypothetical protein